MLRYGEALEAMPAWLAALFSAGVALAGIVAVALGARVLFAAYAPRR